MPVVSSPTPPEDSPPPAGSFRLRAIMKLLCPQCLRGRIFPGLWRMNPECPACGYRFLREQGFFVGAMYFAYGIAVAAAIPAITVMMLLGVPLAWGIAAVSIELTLIAPWNFRISRVLWLHLDFLLGG